MRWPHNFGFYQELIISMGSHYISSICLLTRQVIKLRSETIYIPHITYTDEANFGAISRLRIGGLSITDVGNILAMCSGSPGWVIYFDYSPERESLDSGIELEFSWHAAFSWPRDQCNTITISVVLWRLNREPGLHIRIELAVRKRSLCSLKGGEVEK